MALICGMKNAHVNNFFFNEKEMNLNAQFLRGAEPFLIIDNVNDIFFVL